jgi:hypothetical protein
MGLTIQYQLTAPPETDEAGAREYVMRLRYKAHGFHRRGRVERVWPLGEDRQALEWAREWMYRRVPGSPTQSYEAEVWPDGGWLFAVDLGKGCEMLRLGLCRYPETVRLGGREVRTRLGGWRLTGFCKTQYASGHGWENFLRCHKAAIDLLLLARELGLKVRIEDEGDYWPRRSERALRRNLDQLNAAIAGAAGAMRRYDQAVNGVSAIQSPIFAHPDFARLEAVGAPGGPVRKRDQDG